MGWFDLDENNSKRLTARLSVDATHVRAAIGDRVSILLQNTTVLVTACIIALIYEWRMALVLLATFPLLVMSALAEVLSI